MGELKLGSLAGLGLPALRERTGKGTWVTNASCELILVGSWHLGFQRLQCILQERHGFLPASPHAKGNQHGVALKNVDFLHLLVGGQQDDLFPPQAHDLAQPFPF